MIFNYHKFSYINLNLNKNSHMDWVLPKWVHLCLENVSTWPPFQNGRHFLISRWLVQSQLNFRHRLMVIQRSAFKFWKFKKWTLLQNNCRFLRLSLNTIGDGSCDIHQSSEKDRVQSKLGHSNFENFKMATI